MHIVVIGVLSLGFSNFSRSESGYRELLLSVASASQTEVETDQPAGVPLAILLE